MQGKLNRIYLTLTFEWSKTCWHEDGKKVTKWSPRVSGIKDIVKKKFEQMHASFP